MLKRVFCVILSCFIALSLITLPVSADSSLSTNTSHFISRTKSNYDDYRSGKISFADFLAAVTVDIARYEMVAGAELTGISDILDFLKSLGIDVDNPWEQFYFQHHGGGGSGGNRDEFMKGYGALCIYDTGSSSIAFRYIYCNYIILGESDSNGVLQIRYYGPRKDISYKPDGSVYNESNYNNATTFFVSVGSYADYTFYGDIRYSDGTTADDQITEIPDDPIPGYDDDSVTNDELEDFLEDLLNQLALEYPDLSTVEGLLAAILSQLQSINGKMDNLHVTVDNLSEVKTYLDMAIASIIANGSSSDNSAVVDELVKIREAIKGIDSNSVSDWAELAKLLGFNIDDSDVDKETGNVKDSVITAIINGLCSFVGSLLGTSLSDVVTVSDVTELGTTGIRMLSALVDLLISLSSSFKFQVINSLLSPLQGVMLNNNTPSDLTFNFTYGGDTRSITILPASLLSNSFFANALFIVRTLVSFILLYNWLKWARSFFASSV